MTKQIHAQIKSQFGNPNWLFIIIYIEFKLLIVILPFEQCLISILIQHHICISWIIVHTRIEFHLSALLEWVSNMPISTYPITKFKYRRLIACEVNEWVPWENWQHIEIISKSPIHLICSYLCAEVRRINQEHDIGCILILIKDLFIVCWNNCQTIQIAITRRIIRRTNMLYNVSLSISSILKQYFIENKREEDMVMKSR